MNTKYLLGCIISVPLLPWMLLEGKKLRRSLPAITEARDTTGSTGSGRIYRLLILGESTMAGVGVTSHKDGIAGKLSSYIAETLSAKVIWEVKAKSGYTVAQVYTQLLPKIEMKQPDLILIGIGANDAFRLNTPRQWSEHNASLIKRLQMRYSNTPIVFLNMPPIKTFPALSIVLRTTLGQLVDILGKELELLTKNFNGVHYNVEKISFDRWAQKYKLKNNPNLYYCDGIHPTPLAYNLWAKETFTFIKKKNLLVAPSRQKDYQK